jgi:hypothetical protein
MRLTRQLEITTKIDGKIVSSKSFPELQQEFIAPATEAVHTPDDWQVLWNTFKSTL